MGGLGMALSIEMREVDPDGQRGWESGAYNEA